MFMFSTDATKKEQLFQSYQKALEMLSAGDLVLSSTGNKLKMITKQSFQYRNLDRLIMELNQLCRLVLSLASNPKFKILIYVPEYAMVLYFKEVASTLKFADKIVLVRSISGVLQHRTTNTLLIILEYPSQMLIRKAVSSGIYMICGVYEKGIDISAQQGFYRVRNNFLGVKSLGFLLIFLDQILTSGVPFSSVSKSIQD